MREDRRRVIAFTAITAIAVVVALTYALYAARRGGGEGAPTEIRVVDGAAERDAIPVADRVLYRSTAIGEGYGRVVASRVSSMSERFTTELLCDRVDFAGNAGSCLTADRGVFTTYRAVIFDDRFQTRHTVNLTGIPSRTRVSPDGKLAAFTVFVSGHSYAGGAFSTMTTIVDTASGATVGELEQFAVTRDGKPFKLVDFNFWGVTFASDSNIFYATLGTGNEQLLIRGDVSAKTALVLRGGVECPAISPDGKRLAFKKRDVINGVFGWRLATLDLDTLADRIIPGETRSVDDQVEWLDTTRIAYGMSDDTHGLGGTSVWAVDVDAGTPSSLWIRGAYSASVTRPGQP